MDISDITATDLQDDIIGPIIIDEYREQVTKRMEDGGYMIILSGYSRSVFQDFESYLRTEIDLVQDDIKLVLDKYKSSFITFEIDSCIYTFKDLSEVLFKILKSQYENTGEDSFYIEYDDITMKTKLIVWSGIVAKKFDEKSFFSAFLGFTSRWDWKHYNKYTSQKVVSLGSTNKIHLKCDCIDGSVLNGFRQTILFSFVLDKKLGSKVFCATETIHYKKIKKSVLNTITFYLEDNDHNDVDFNGKKMTFTLQMIKITTDMATYNYLSVYIRVYKQLYEYLNEW